ncbi:MAG: DUF1559 domain-containing protein [Pirellulales bacterium]|nr:DUF1559 domain-containing protein [Pirellulales bacterium]
MTKYFRYVLPLLMVFATCGFAAEKTFDPVTRAKTVAPVVDEMTRLVAHVDLSQLQVDSSVSALERIVPPAALDGERVRGQLAAIQAMFQKAGITDLYVVVSLDDMPNGYFFIVSPLPKGRESMPQKTPQLADWLGKDRSHAMVLERLGDLAFFGTPRTLERLRKLKPVDQVELAQAFAAAGDTDLQIALLVSDDDRRVVEELFPTLPKLLGGGPSTIVTHGLRWAALGLDFPPEPKLRMVIESKDHQAAEALNAKIAEVLPLVVSGKIFGGKTEERTLAADALRLAALVKPSVKENRIEYTLGANSKDADSLCKLLAVPLTGSLDIIWRRQTADKLKQLGLAMHNYHDSKKSFPAQANYDKEGRPLLSWRVHVLPYIDQLSLYRQFHLDEPWDSPHNRKLIEKMPEAYAMPNSSARHQYRTCFVRPVGENTVCPGKKAIKIKEITDGTSNTIMIVEVDEKNAVVWTKPDDIVVDPKQPAKGLGGHFKGGFWTTFCDGSARFISISAKIDPQQLRAVFSRNGGEPVNHNKW